MNEILTRFDNPGWFTPNLIFVIMSFEKKWRKYYLCIKDECTKLGLEVLRADEIPGSVPIADMVREYLSKAEFIICDLTGERHNVYYELGLAQGAGNAPLDIFLIAKEDTKIHFNIAAFRIRYFRTTRDLRTLISNDFKEMIKERRKRENFKERRKKKQNFTNVKSLLPAIKAKQSELK
ncbi:MAG TPA: hypothetical protein VIJ25_03335 [Methylococcales bacterium]|jgi:hypothetical protein